MKYWCESNKIYQNSIYFGNLKQKKVFLRLANETAANTEFISKMAYGEKSCNYLASLPPSYSLRRIRLSRFIKTAAALWMACCFALCLSPIFSFFLCLPSAKHHYLSLTLAFRPMRSHIEFALRESFRSSNEFKM